MGIQGAKVTLSGLEAVSNTEGHFGFVLADDDSNSALPLRAEAEGYRPATLPVDAVPGSFVSVRLDAIDWSAVLVTDTGSTPIPEARLTFRSSPSSSLRIDSEGRASAPIHTLLLDREDARTDANGMARIAATRSGWIQVLAHGYVPRIVPREDPEDAASPQQVVLTRANRLQIEVTTNQGPPAEPIRVQVSQPAVGLQTTQDAADGSCQFDVHPEHPILVRPLADGYSWRETRLDAGTQRFRIFLKGRGPTRVKLSLEPQAPGPLRVFDPDNLLTYVPSTVRADGVTYYPANPKRGRLFTWSRATGLRQSGPVTVQQGTSPTLHLEPTDSASATLAIELPEEATKARFSISIDPGTLPWARTADSGPSLGHLLLSVPGSVPPEQLLMLTEFTADSNPLSLFDLPKARFRVTARCGDHLYFAIADLRQGDQVVVMREAALSSVRVQTHLDPSADRGFLCRITVRHIETGLETWATRIAGDSHTFTELPVGSYTASVRVEETGFAYLRCRELHQDFELTERSNADVHVDLDATQMLLPRTRDVQFKGPAISRVAVLSASDARQHPRIKPLVLGYEVQGNRIRIPLPPEATHLIAFGGTEILGFGDVLPDDASVVHLHVGHHDFQLEDASLSPQFGASFLLPSEWTAGSSSRVPFGRYLLRTDGEVREVRVNAQGVTTR